MLRVMIESPYAGNVERNVPYARMAMRHSLDLGEAPMAGHLLYTQMLEDAIAAERVRGLQAGYEWMAVADLVAFYVDHGWSPGMMKAIKVARLLHKKCEIRRILRSDQPIDTGPYAVGDVLADASVVDFSGEPLPGVRLYTFKPRDEL